MTKLLSILFAFTAFSMVAVDFAEAASRMGGGRSIGRQSAQPAQRTAPAQQQQATQSAATKTQPQAAPQSGMSKWLGPLAGLAIGAGLASLFLNNGLAGALAGILMALAIGAGLFFLIRLLMRGRARPQEPQYAGASSSGGNVGGAFPPSSAPAQFSGNAAPGSLAATLGGGAGNIATASRWPEGFDAAGFERQAKSNFISLQAANDSGDASTLRDFLTPELYREVETEMKSAWGKPQKNDVVELNAEVIDVVTENNLYVVSVNFTGRISENGAAAESFSEIWHLEKPVSGRSGWMVSGIQQN